MDFVGATLVAAAVTCVVLALQWGGNTKPWNDKAVIIVCHLDASQITYLLIIYHADVRVLGGHSNSLYCMGKIFG